MCLSLAFFLTAHAKVAVATIASGPQAVLACKLLVLSYSKNGAPDAIPLFVFTPHANIELFNVSRHIFVKRIIAESNSLLPSVRAKLVKMKLLEYVPVEFDEILYLDADIVIGMPIEYCIEVIRSQMSPRSVIGMFPEPYGLVRGEPFHSGVIWIIRGKSDEYLRKWYVLFSTGKYKRDQTAFGDLSPRLVSPLGNDGSRSIFAYPHYVVNDLKTCCFFHQTRWHVRFAEKYNYSLASLEFYFKVVLRLPRSAHTRHKF